MSLKPFAEPLRVTRPGLPSLETYGARLQSLWDDAWLTNGGPVAGAFKKALAEHHGQDRLELFANGTAALEAMLLCLGLRGEVVTTPYTYVATGNALLRCGLEPVFVDIDPVTLTIDPDAAERAITEKTCAILGVHVFGQPCHLERLQEIAARHGIKLLYDAAHAFDIRVDGAPIASFGDASMFSLHATKPVQAVEGGLVAFRDPALAEPLWRIQNHGIGTDGLHGPGIATNAKMSELHALMGVLSLERIAVVRERLLRIEAIYREGLASLPGIRPATRRAEGLTGFFSFFPILITEREAGVTRDALAAYLERYNVFGRKYFAPLLTDMPAFSNCTKKVLSVAQAASETSLALPYYTDLNPEDARTICDIIKDCVNRRKRTSAWTKKILNFGH